MKNLIWDLFVYASPAILALVGWVSVKLATLIQARTKNEYIKGVLLRLNDAVWNAVREVEQTMVKALKAGEVDGKLTTTGQMNAKTAAIATIKEHLGPEGLRDLANILGLTGQAVETFLGKRVEAAIAASKEKTPSPFFPR